MAFPDRATSYPSARSADTLIDQAAARCSHLAHVIVALSPLTIGNDDLVFDHPFMQRPAPPIAIPTTTALSHPHRCLITTPLNLSTLAVLLSLDFHIMARHLSIFSSLIIFASVSSRFPRVSDAVGQAFVLPMFKDQQIASSDIWADALPQEIG
jgi:hypothetical protein